MFFARAKSGDNSNRIPPVLLLLLILLRFPSRGSLDLGRCVVREQDRQSFDREEKRAKLLPLLVSFSFSFLFSFLFSFSFHRWLDSSVGSHLVATLLEDRDSRYHDPHDCSRHRFRLLEGKCIELELESESEYGLRQSDWESLLLLRHRSPLGRVRAHPEWAERTILVVMIVVVIVVVIVFVLLVECVE